MCGPEVVGNGYGLGLECLGDFVVEVQPEFGEGMGKAWGVGPCGVGSWASRCLG